MAAMRYTTDYRAIADRPFPRGKRLAWSLRALFIARIIRRQEQTSLLLSSVPGLPAAFGSVTR